MSDKSDFVLSDVEQAVLLLIKEGLHSIPSNIFTTDVKNRLLDLKLIQFDDNREVGWFITSLGERAVQTKIAIKYPLHVRGKIGDYDKVIETMTDGAKDALACALVNNHFFDDLKVPTFRVLMQDMLTKGLFRKFGKELSVKWLEALENEHKDKTKER